jgi:hypothetical protein
MSSAPVPPIAQVLAWCLRWLSQRPLGVFVSLAVLGGAVTVFHLSPSAVAAWLLVAAVCAVVVADNVRARELLRDVVLLRWAGPPVGRCLTSRAESLTALAAAFSYARAGDTIAAEVALARVDRCDLGPWESRVVDAVRALVSVEVADEIRAAQLVPLALPTGDLAVDRALAAVAVRAAWDDERRLSVLGRGVTAAGAHLDDVGALCSLRSDELRGHLEVLPPACPPEVVDRARDVGDDRFADLLASLAARRGVYRLRDAHSATAS